MRSSKLTVGALLATLVLGACSGSGSTPTNAPVATSAAGQPTAAYGGATTAPGGGAADSCAAITVADIKTATGADYSAGVADGSDTCDWTINATDTYAVVSVSFLAGTSLAATKTGIPGGTDTTVGGHNAYWGPHDNILQAIWVDLGSSLLMITIAPAPANAQDITKSLAESAVARM